MNGSQPEDLVDQMVYEEEMRFLAEKATHEHAMKIVTEIPIALVRKVITSLMENYPEAGAGCALQCTKWKYAKLEFTFYDYEEEKEHKVTEVELTKAFGLMFTDKWPKGCTQPPHMASTAEQWEDWLCQADAIDDDAFVQLAIFGEVIYG